MYSTFLSLIQTSAISGRVTIGALEKTGWEMLQHPPYSPDLAPSSFHLFWLLKEFEHAEQIQKHVYKF
jgi:histone-lysine N-methyltransferase SETMAR